MGTLSSDLKHLGYEPTEQESPFDDDGTLWSDGVELVCDETGIVIDTTEAERMRGDDAAGNRTRFRYPNSNKVRMLGGFFSNYFD